MILGNKQRCLLALLLGFAFLLADEEGTHDLSFAGYPTPWFTGPLIAPSGYTAQAGHFSVQPFLDAFVTIGGYNSHWKSYSTPNFYNTNLRVRLKAGVTGWLDLQLTPQIFYQETQGAHSVNIGDFLAAINIQLLTSQLKDPWPAFKLMLHARIPSGKYQNLRTSLKGTDATGVGCAFPEASLTISKLWHLSQIHFLELRVVPAYRIGTPTSVHGLNVYGGDSSTRGTEYPGNIFSLDTAIQYNFTQSWACACDLYYLHTNHNRFSGKTSSSMTSPSREQLSLAPALEYNWSKNVGLIAGIWFSLAGRNTSQFVNGILSLNAYF